MIINTVKGQVKPEFKEKFIAHLATEHMQSHLAEAQPWFDSLEMETFESTKFDLF